MRRGWRLLCAIVVLVTTGCFESHVVTCADGTICGPDLVCDDVLGGCVSPTPCAGHADGDPCRGLGVSAGICDMGACVMAGVCGDGQRTVFEECDDGGLLSHDGCSSTCRAETLTWSGPMTAGSPPQRTALGMAYNMLHGDIVLFGGAGANNDLADTWVWNGTWTDRTPASSPSARQYAAMTYDVAHDDVVLFGGWVLNPQHTFFGDTWTWNGTSWTDVSPATSPAPRLAAAMTPNVGGNGILLFGGAVEPPNNGPVMMLDGETWVWNGTTWTKRTPANAPTPRIAHAMAYDAARDRVVLFGGTDDINFQITPVGDTWEWDGSTWTERTPALSPSPRGLAAMTYDPVRRRVILFGGCTAVEVSNICFEENRLGDTWEWDGTTWTETTPTTSPVKRADLQMAYDGISRSAVMFGGFQAETWQYHATSTSPDESCIDGVDADGDGLAGCADPDCWAWCTPTCPPGATCGPAAHRCGDGVCDADLEAAVCPADCP